MPPNPMTEACATFFLTHQQLVDFDLYLARLVRYARDIEAAKHTTLAELYDLKAQTGDDLSDAGGASDARAKAEEHRLLVQQHTQALVNEQSRFSNTVCQMTLSRAVDNFVAYFRDLLHLIAYWAARVAQLSDSPSDYPAWLAAQQQAKQELARKYAELAPCNGSGMAAAREIAGSGLSNVDGVPVAQICAKTRGVLSQFAALPKYDSPALSGALAETRSFVEGAC